MSRSPERISSYRRHFEDVSASSYQVRMSSPSPTRRMDRTGSAGYPCRPKDSIVRVQSAGRRTVSASRKSRIGIAGAMVCVGSSGEPAIDLDAAAAENQEFISVRTNERQEMIVLNDRLAVYIDKVRSLEQQNKLLEAEIEAYQNRFEKPSGLRLLYEEQLKELKRIAEQMRVQRDISITVKESAAAQLEAMKAKYEEAVELRRKTESEIELFRPDVDKATSSRIILEKKLEQLEIDIEFLKRVHQQEIDELMRQIYSAHVTAQSAFTLPDLAGALKQIQTQYDDIAAKNLEEMDSWYKTKFEDITNKTSKHVDRIRSVREEIAGAKKDIQNKDRDLDSLRSRNEALEAQILERQEKYKKELEDMQARIEAVQLELRSTKEKIALHLREYQDLLNIKMALEIEITTYRKLIEGEDLRLADTVQTLSITGYSFSAITSGMGGGGGGGGGGMGSAGTMGGTGGMGGASGMSGTRGIGGASSMGAAGGMGGPGGMGGTENGRGSTWGTGGGTGIGGVTGAGDSAAGLGTGARGAGHGLGTGGPDDKMGLASMGGAGHLNGGTGHRAGGVGGDFGAGSGSVGAGTANVGPPFGGIGGGVGGLRTTAGDPGVAGLNGGPNGADASARGRGAGAGGLAGSSGGLGSGSDALDGTGRLGAGVGGVGGSAEGGGIGGLGGGTGGLGGGAEGLGAGAGSVPVGGLQRSAGGTANGVFSPGDGGPHADAGGLGSGGDGFRTGGEGEGGLGAGGVGTGAPGIAPGARGVGNVAGAKAGLSPEGRGYTTSRMGDDAGMGDAGADLNATSDAVGGGKARAADSRADSREKDHDIISVGRPGEIGDGEGPVGVTKTGTGGGQAVDDKGVAVPGDGISPSGLKSGGGMVRGYGSNGYDDHIEAYPGQAVELTERRTVLIRTIKNEDDVQETDHREQLYTISGAADDSDNE